MSQIFIAGVAVIGIGIVWMLQSGPWEVIVFTWPLFVLGFALLVIGAFDSRKNKATDQDSSFMNRPIHPLWILMALATGFIILWKIVTHYFDR